MAKSRSTQSDPGVSPASLPLKQMVRLRHMPSQKRKVSLHAKRLEEALEGKASRAEKPTPLRRDRPVRAAAGMAGQVRAVLIPVEPSQQFVRELGRGLAAAAARSRQSLVRRYRLAIVIGAAVLGSIASVVGVIALIVRQRSRMRTGLLRSVRGG